MCYYTEQSALKINVKRRFKAEIDNEESFYQSDYISGFSYPNIPIILDTSPQMITTDFTWGLIPFWAKDNSIRKNTLNARIETVSEKPSFRNITQNRCLIIATGYYEWHWNDEKGKTKEKFRINSKEDEIFTFAGLYTSWKNSQSGEVENTYTMLTTEANEVMSYVHNHKKRMPVLLNKKDEVLWLDKSIKVEEFAFPNYEGNLEAKKL